MLGEMEGLIQEMIEMQQRKLLRLGREIIPNLTSDDVLQPMDFSELEGHPTFRYEEGVLAGMQALHMALRAQHIRSTNDPLRS